MLSWIAGGVLALAVSEGPRDELVAAAAKLAAAESYQFTSLTEMEGGFRGGEPAPPQPVHGEVAKQKPMHLKLGETEAFKDGETIAWRGAGGEWEAFDPESLRGGFGRGGRGGGEGGGEGGGRGGEGGDAGGGERPRGEGGGGMRAMFTLSRLEPPHALFAELAGKIADEVEATHVAAVDAVEGEAPAPAKTVYSGALTEAGAEALGGRGGFGRGGRGGGPDMEHSGTYTIEVVDGVVTGAKLTITRAGSFGERDFEVTSVQTLSFSKLGEVDYDLPEGALALFEI